MQGEQRAKLAKAGAFFRERSLPAAFFAWQSATVQRALHRATLARCLAALMLRTQHTAWTSWAAAVQRRRRKNKASLLQVALVVDKMLDLCLDHPWDSLDDWTGCAVF